MYYHVVHCFCFALALWRDGIIKVPSRRITNQSIQLRTWKFRNANLNLDADAHAHGAHDLGCFQIANRMANLRIFNPGIIAIGSLRSWSWTGGLCGRQQMDDIIVFWDLQHSLCRQNLFPAPLNWKIPWCQLIVSNLRFMIWTPIPKQSEDRSWQKWQRRLTCASFTWFCNWPSWESTTTPTHADDDGDGAIFTWWSTSSTDG